MEEKTMSEYHLIPHLVFLCSSLVGNTVICMTKIQRSIRCIVSQSNNILGGLKEKEIRPVFRRCGGGGGLNVTQLLAK